MKDEHSHNIHYRPMYIIAVCMFGSHPIALVFDPWLCGQCMNKLLVQLYIEMYYHSLGFP